ncbi:zona pellucida sperm-binding protein 3 receptor-like [Ptychodera flava]|uniref:zona pellucida sperm-binding protein 3 receptor-like n=1 Tax=Ptychodera flava TaxID=63121 RepID=UPI00396A5F7B
MTSLIIVGHVAGEFFIPNGITLYWNNPSGTQIGARSVRVSISVDKHHSPGCCHCWFRYILSGTHFYNNIQQSYGHCHRNCYPVNSGANGGEVNGLDIYFRDNSNTKITETVQPAGGAAPTIGNGVTINPNQNHHVLTGSVTIKFDNEAICSDAAKICALIKGPAVATNAAEYCLSLGTAYGHAGAKDCIAHDCTDPGIAPTNGQKMGSDYTHGQTVTYACDTGYTLSGPGVLSCTNGSWNYPRPTCKAGCNDPGPAPVNGTKTGTDYTHGATVSYTCDEGYILSGPGILTCSDGSWDNTAPTCLAIGGFSTETPDPSMGGFSTETLDQSESDAGGKRLSVSVTVISMVFLPLFAN